MPRSHALDSIEHWYQGEKPLKTLLAIYRNDALNLILALIFYIIKSSPVWAMPLMTANIIDIISQPDQHPLSEMYFYIAVYVVIFAQNIPTHYLYIRFLSTATRNMELNLRSALADRLQHLSISFYYRNSTGVLQAKLLRDVEAIEQLTKQLFDNVPEPIMMILFAIIVTAIRVPWFLIFFLMTVPAAVILYRSMREPIQKRNQVFRGEIEVMSAHLAEMIRLIPVTRAHGIEEDEIQELEEKLKQVRAAGLRLDGINALFGASSWVVFRLFDVMCLIVAAFAAYTHIIPVSVGDVVMLTGFFSNLTNSILRLANMIPIISKGFDSIRSLGEIFESPDIEQNEGKAVVDSVSGHFVFEAVSYSYPNNDDHSVCNISLEVQPGETIAVVGPSGAGKSTLLNLIIGFLRPSSGRILLDGRDMSDLDLRTYRHFLSVVSQETILFQGTIRENILYGVKNTDEEKLKQAVESANANFIYDLPLGLETMLGENGARLSGGQRQRIAIARALIRDPRVLILDEATSSVDTASEALIQQALERLMKNRTTFMVAHRLSTVKNADRIVVLDQGRLVEIGSHTELLSAKGVYARLHRNPEPATSNF